MSLIFFIRPFSESTTSSRRSLGEGRGMPTPAVGSLQLPLNQNLDTTSDSHGQAAFPQELLRAEDQGRGQVLPWHYCSFHKFHKLLSPSGRVLLWTVAGHLGPFADFDGLGSPPPLGASWSILSIVHLCLTQQRTSCSSALQIRGLHFKVLHWPGEDKKNES
uniref:Uncharacterized protein n=1 Tax=Rousettus aegyptiacus TaxID=9407 RepID=A0A7J8FI44_ROUAE|nr:hypothetical protein HJG63_011895 [Rousettus aegyptiacus]